VPPPVEPLAFAPPPHELSAIAAKASNTNAAAGADRKRTCRPASCRTITKTKNTAPLANSNMTGICRSPCVAGHTLAPAVVVTVAVTNAGGPGVTAAVLGESAHVAPAGAPLHDIVTVCANPATDPTTIEYVAGCPAATVAVDVADAITVKSGPLPVSDTVCGLPVAPSATESVAVRVPTPLGLNVTLI
jgi:hypothetical protein